MTGFESPFAFKIATIRDNEPEQTLELLKQRNPRIQVTNATCELDEIIDEDKEEDNSLGPDEIDTEMTKLKNDYNLSKNKLISKVIQNCDTDLYAAQKPFKTKIPATKCSWDFIFIRSIINHQSSIFNQPLHCFCKHVSYKFEIQTRMNWCVVLLLFNDLTIVVHNHLWCWYIVVGSIRIF